MPVTVSDPDPIMKILNIDCLLGKYPEKYASYG
jgi:hypothetical protein